MRDLTTVFWLFAGVYASGIFRFNITFPAQYPALPPSILFTTDVFHPLITPTSTYRHAAPDSDLGTGGAADQSRSPPGTLDLKHGFPHWPEDVTTSPVPILRVLYYLRAVFVHATMLDSIAFDDAANTSAWHAYQAFRNDVPMQSIHHRDGRVQESLAALDGLRLASGPSSHSEQSQPGGARTPDQWSWNRVWEERLTKTIQQSSADRVLYAEDPESNNMASLSGIIRLR